ncbi:DMT family transporter [Bacilliculturomica massiliensis]|uniref:DMT family transporter n=1 Tax=Bacilliculturomica massiliensis TaxID=1917867 RepID=UPI0013EEF034|nr:DMT family transporter [Bacilliculturomica massiliensis]
MNRKVVSYVFFSAFIFSTMEVALKIGGGSFDPLQITLIRFFIGGLVLLPLALDDLRKRQVSLTRGDYGYLAFLGILCICVSMLFFQFGVMYSHASTAAVVFSVNPMFTMLFAHFFTEEKLNRRKVMALAVSLGGIAVMMNPFHLAEGNTVRGMVCIVMAALTFGLYSAAGKLRIKRLGGFTQTSVSFILGSAVLAVLMGFMGRPVISGISAANVPILLYVGVVVTGIGYLLYFKAIEAGGAAKASVVFFIKPMIAPVIALVILHEAITLQTVTGVGILLIGSYINMTDNSGAAAPEGGDTDGDGHEDADRRAG